MAQLLLDSIAIDCPNAAELAKFYGALLNTDVQDGAVSTNDGTVEIWFQEVEDYLPPTWPSQTRGQQVHLDLAVADVDEAVRVAQEMGGKLTDPQEGFHHPIILDPAGHPICLFAAEDDSPGLAGITFDSDDSSTLADFYAALVGATVAGGEGWTSVERDKRPNLYFQDVPDYLPPTWPSQERGQQAHIDFHTDDRIAEVSRAVSLGAEEVQVNDGFTVMLDPSGHPFCICDLH